MNIPITQFHVALAEQSAEQYITAEQAREFVKAGGQVEEFYTLDNPHAWRVCHAGHPIPTWRGDKEVKYRAIKQAQPEPVEPMVLRSDFDHCMQDKQRCVKLIEDVHALLCAGKDTHAKELLEKRVNNQNVDIPPFIEPVDPHAALRAEYAKQVAEGTTGFYLWEWKYQGGVWQSTNAVGRLNPSEDYQYRYTDISCMVAKQGEPAKRMLRTEAQELQRQTKDTHNWFHVVNIPASNIFDFDCGGTYTYAPKALKQVSWSDMPQFVKVRHKSTKQTFTFLGVDTFGYLVVFRRDCDDHSYNPPALELAHASEQPWIAVQDGQHFESELRKDGLMYHITYGAGVDDAVVRFKVVGLEDGYVLEGAV